MQNSSNNAPNCVAFFRVDSERLHSTNNGSVIGFVHGAVLVIIIAPINVVVNRWISFETVLLEVLVAAPVQKL